ncbi:manganese efflux pump [Heliorestis acidaminivorans]|uniref:Putative manganese efflux pump MntP n=1 Tax=Heliorestis acidaminivorans TaxID=553427 RepID=A0A6I0F560_9FIRM|nr:manganese efflux pump [Heliorestis acidaminivorans]KAB2953817.1 manganese efflux pump [Heliorestis acidaminivorans]
MDIGTLVILAIGLGADAFSVAIGIGIEGIRRRDIYILGAIIGIFHVIMPWVGLIAGGALGAVIGQLAVIIGALILFFLGGKILYEAWFKEAGPTIGLGGHGQATAGGLRPDPMTTHFSPSFYTLVILAAGVSMDALTVGFSLGTVGAELVTTILTFGIVAAIMTIIGCFIGRRVGPTLGVHAQVVGGLILIGIGIKLLLW